MRSQLATDREHLRAEFEQRAAGADARRAHETALQAFHARLLPMHASSNPQQCRREFEAFLNDPFALWDLIPRAAYDLDHEQIDGAFTFRTGDYLLEARWWREPLQPKELNDFRAKIDAKARSAQARSRRCPRRSDR